MAAALLFQTRASLDVNGLRLGFRHIDDMFERRRIVGARQEIKQIFMASITEFRAYTNTPARRNTFYSYCTTRFVQDQAIFFLLVDAFKAEKSKRQAIFLNEWFIKGNIPAEYTDNGYLGIVNISSGMQGTISSGATAAVSAVGRTFADKMSNQGGGVRGFFGAVKQKLGDTTVSPTLFDAAQAQVVTMLDDGGRHGFGGVGGVGATYKPDGTYQPIGSFSQQVIRFRKDLKVGGFDADKLGIF